ncbi:hypothetical protein HFN78_22365 [Rhizobium laguerreae]|uniref:hypothetical protein n=1 Tax=Rhizobium laguerreae TaxID=1076926 RepID=UPI001C911319|nr:hypothetical protein [Rhizobium laguerreae]MBY3473628.1 hypothetical protein [Rhizobium laguerreae]MBY3521636.1 hypothetical protein [Rhizobium laguerreae]
MLHRAGLIAAMIGMANVALAQAGPAQPQQQIENPGRNATERWVWEEVRAGRVADLHAHCNADLDPRAGDDARWRDPCRAISAAFFERVLTEEPWRSGIPFRGLQLIGARLSESLDLGGAPIAAQVLLLRSRFEGEVSLVRARIDSLLSLDGSTFEGGIDANSLQADNDLSLRNGAVVRGGPLVLLGAKIEGHLVMDGSTFENGIDAGNLQVGKQFVLSEGAIVRGGSLVLAGAKIGGDLGMDGSTFENGIDANRLEVRGDFVLRNGAIVRGGPLVLVGAKIENDLQMSGSTFERGVDANSLQVGGNLLLTERAVVRGGALELASARIEGDLQMNTSTFEGGIDANSLQVGGSLLLRLEAVVRNKSLQLSGANVGTDLDLRFSTFERVEAYGLRVGANMFLGEATLKQRSQIRFSKIDGMLNLSGARLSGLDLTHSTIGSLNLGGSQSAPPEWTAEAEMTLRGTRIKMLLDQLDSSEPCPDQDAWPSELDLQGFVYEQLGADPGHDKVEMRERKDMRERDACWYEKWLGRDRHFAPQPYQQLASVLRTTGEPGRADAVLYAGRDRERAEAWTRGKCNNPFEEWPWRRGECWKATGLALLKVLIGYGIGSGLFLVFYWVLTFTLVGMLVLLFSPSARAKGTAWMLGASLDHLLPIVSLNKEFDDFFNDPGRKRLKGWQLGYFALHALFGFLLGSFVVAALAGLTQIG